LITKAEGQRAFPSVTSKKNASFSLSFRAQPQKKPQEGKRPQTASLQAAIERVLASCSTNG